MKALKIFINHKKNVFGCSKSGLFYNMKNLHIKQLITKLEIYLFMRKMTTTKCQGGIEEWYLYKFLIKD
ncbi:hypothetical protein CSW08_13485 [Confluentibacter flavum]|uniref:Uncharacterized protein n=1 Tax=Confluentibacter flavum TaxID=1909700 RepID=A0A2N3HHX8_9FLAO|nr:hypothetical protein CSW08_13485 [Confluentibacter flavum]